MFAVSPHKFPLGKGIYSDQDENTFEKERSEARKFNFGILKPSDVIVQKSENDFPTYHEHYHLPAVNSQFWVKSWLLEWIFLLLHNTQTTLKIKGLSRSYLLMNTTFDNNLFLCLLGYCMSSWIFCNILHYEINQSSNQWKVKPNTYSDLSFQNAFQCPISSLLERGQCGLQCGACSKAEVQKRYHRSQKCKEKQI